MNDGKAENPPLLQEERPVRLFISNAKQPQNYRVSLITAKTLLGGSRRDCEPCKARRRRRRRRRETSESRLSWLAAKDEVPSRKIAFKKYTGEENPLISVGFVGFHLEGKEKEEK
ncbi:hypothetical protein H6P81_002443 [Aristolochia fimbriata]|uniref:Uncharacterized protein n=1 Tax=Aristolochia fimbriata TaxID=158543 RepID=A0AAV7F9T2_ARIFI|nr:hypothetical protein H6P81_002443 [Aristolochia fimbriata]